MAIRRSSAQQTAVLLADLDGADAIAREAAIARLAIAGARVVDPLLAALPRASADGRLAILRVIEMLAEPRTLTVAIAATRAASQAEALAAVAAVRAQLGSRAREAADAALDALTALALDEARPEAVRVATIDALSDLGPEVVASIRAQLAGDGAERVRRAAGLEGPVATALEAAAARLEAAKNGAADDPEVLERLLRDAGGSIALSTLHELVLVFRRHERAARAAAERSRWIAARAAAHAALAQRASRLALFDLRDELSGSADPHPDIVAAAAVLGDASCLEPLGAALTRARSDDQRAAIVRAGQAVVERDGLTRRHAAVRQMLARTPGAAVFLGPSARAVKGA